jgi:cobalamin biosynthesis protein CobT
LVEEAQARLLEATNPEKFEAIKAFANVAMIAEMLSAGFEALAEEFTQDYEIDEMLDTAESLQTLAEDSAKVAEALRAGTLTEAQEGLREAFNDAVGNLIPDLEFFDEFTEDGDECEDGDEEGEDDDDDDDEEDDEEMDEDEAGDEEPDGNEKVSDDEEEDDEKKEAKGDDEEEEEEEEGEEDEKGKGEK